MAVLIDTDVFSYVLRRDPRANLYDKHLEGQQQFICFAVVAELLQGADKARWGDEKRSRLESAVRTVTVIPYDLAVCRAWAKLWDARNPDGSARTIGCSDRWIAACAIQHAIPLITHNRSHFEGLPGLHVISEAP
jgi:predicted nucleic acid-binding protein